MLNGHIDTVGLGAMPDLPAATRDGMFGRGTYDMKRWLRRLHRRRAGDRRGGHLPGARPGLVGVADEEGEPRHSTF